MGPPLLTLIAWGCAAIRFDGPVSRPLARGLAGAFAIASLGAATSRESWSRAIAAMTRQAFFIARAREIFRPGWVDTRKTGQSLP